tara:strand:- start:68 stop:1633 length:1566 start_codon:yes stop_codon:yes gene_type:complete
LSTIVTRSGKGSALTHTEMDANVTNLNTDKLQNIVEDLSPQLGANLDVNTNNIVSTTGTVVIEATTDVWATGDKVYLNAPIIYLGKNNTDTRTILNRVPGAILKIAQNPSGGGPVIELKTDDLVLSPDPSAGNVIIDGLTYPSADGTVGQLLKTDGAGNLSFTAASGFSGDLAGNELTDSTGTLNIDASASNRIKYENSDGAPTNGSILFNAYGYAAGGTTYILSAMEYRTTGAFRLNKVEARGGTDNGTHDAYMYLYGEDNRLISQNPTTQAYVPLELRASETKVYNGNTYLYKLPTADGSANQVLKTDGGGNLSFTTPSAFDGNLAGNNLTDSVQDLALQPSGSTDAKMVLTDNGSDSINILLQGDSSDAVGPLVQAKDETDAFSNITFSGKQQDFRAYNVAAGTGKTRFFSDTGTYFYINNATPVLRMFFGTSGIEIRNSDGDTQLTLLKVDSAFGKAQFSKEAIPQLPFYNATSLPTATSNTGLMAMYVQSGSGNDPRPVYSDGTVWRYTATDVQAL